MIIAISEKIQRTVGLQHLGRPLAVNGDGNFLFKALSIHIIGDTSLATKIRLRTTADELI